MSMKQDITLWDFANTDINNVSVQHRSEYKLEPNEINSLNDLEDSHRIMKQLNMLDWAFSSANTTYLSHNIHPYPAKFIPQIPRIIITLLSMRGELVWDPFGGSGTTAVWRNPKWWSKLRNPMLPAGFRKKRN